ncbi:TPA: hypothetical protein NGT37_001032 [Vibrio parahaemolyticus]|nr:hypothetical protein [Vibrio parahaemolyticus]
MISKQEALKIWQERQQKQTDFVMMVLKNRDYNVEYNGAKITATSEFHSFECFITDDHVTFKDSDLCLPIEQFSLWLDS